jgi:hypothetical protein
MMKQNMILNEGWKFEKSIFDLNPLDYVAARNCTAKSERLGDIFRVTKKNEHIPLKLRITIN